MKKRIISLICIIAAFSMCLAACGKDGADVNSTVPSGENLQGSVKSASIVLPYSSGDSLNPFFATGVENIALSFLWCQPLFEVKNDYSPEAILADSFNIENTSVSVSLKAAKFSDGSDVSAKDVVYSFNKAKQSPAFSQRLSNIASAKQNGGSVVFTLSTPDAFALNVLTFPIVKTSSADTAAVIPTGSGVFAFGDSGTLTLNGNSGVQSSITEIKLNDIKDLTYIKNELEIGNINYLFEDFSSGSYNRIVAQNKTVTLNNFVFLGMNSGYGALASSAIRTAIYYSIGKENVSASAYQGYAKAAATPFNPDFCQLSGVSVPTVQSDVTKCASIFEKLGYNRYAKSGARTNGTNNLEFSILVNADNTFRQSVAYKIAENLNDVGIRANVEAVASDVYQQRVATGNFQLYVGEVKLTENMDLSVFLNGAASVGIDKTIPFFADYTAFREGTIGMESVVASFMNDVPFVPICYRCGMAAYSKTLSPDFTYSPFNVYGNIENWEITNE